MGATQRLYCPFFLLVSALSNAVQHCFNGEITVYDSLKPTMPIQGRRYWGGVGGCNTPPIILSWKSWSNWKKNWSKYIIGHF